VVEYHEIAGQSWHQLHEWFVAAGFHLVRQDEITDRVGTAWFSRTPIASA
jgi:hypothetical protein